MCLAGAEPVPKFNLLVPSAKAAWLQLSWRWHLAGRRSCRAFPDGGGSLDRRASHFPAPARRPLLVTA